VLSIAGVVSVVIFIAVAYSCARNGLFSTLTMLFVLVLSGAAAMMCLGPLPRLMVIDRMGSFAPAVCFMVVFLVSLVVLQTLANYLLPPKVTLPKIADIGGGAALGLVAALFTTGALMTGYALFPGTGEAGDKVVIFGADAFYVRSMSLMSGAVGSSKLDAADFLRRARQEKYVINVRERTSTDFEDENIECGRNLWQLGIALKAYTAATRDNYPASLSELAEYVPGHLTDAQRQAFLVCPLTKRPYTLFPVKNWAEVKDDPRYVVIFDTVGGPAGHRGIGDGKRMVLYANGKNAWVSDNLLSKILADQITSAKLP
jgi:hypothetical protein